jgi:DNA-binding NarL/FixJ family response regulator
MAELTKRHITDVVEAEPTWVTSEFGHLVSHQTWSGRVLLRRLSGDSLKVSVNAYSSPLPDGSAEHVAFLDATYLDGPAIVRLPDAALDYGLTVADLRLLHLIAAGFSDTQIADVLGVSEKAIKDEFFAVGKKLNASSRVEAVVIAVWGKLIV